LEILENKDTFNNNFNLIYNLSIENNQKSKKKKKIFNNNSKIIKRTASEPKVLLEDIWEEEKKEKIERKKTNKSYYNFNDDNIIKDSPFNELFFSKFEKNLRLYLNTLD